MSIQYLDKIWTAIADVHKHFDHATMEKTSPKTIILTDLE